MTCSILVGGAWGDEGKGKCITYLCGNDKPDIIARAGVGPNAGHSVEFNGEKYGLRLIPSGFVHTDAKLMIGAGVLVDKDVLFKEFEDLKKYDKKLLLQDPRFSTTGRDFLNWTVAAYGDNWKDYWRSIKKSVYSLSKSWDESFKEFETSNDFIMLSYATDGAY